MRSLVAAGLVGMASVAVLAAQAPVVVSSVKLSRTVDEGIKGNGGQGGAYRVANAPLTVILGVAYGVGENRILGGPDWIRHDRWDVEAKADRPDGAPAVPVRDLVRAVLRDRFQLDAAMERRDRPVYALRVASTDGKLGPFLVPSKFECKERDVEQQAAVRASGVKGAHGEAACGVRSQRDILAFGGMTLQNLLGPIYADRVIVDQTGLTGPYDLTLTWTYTGDPVADQASMYAAMREQLGLKLESATAPLDVLVIKSVRKPAAN